MDEDIKRIIGPPRSHCPICTSEVYYQPSREEFPEDMFSFQVVSCIEGGKSFFPEVENWVEYRGDDIEGVSFIDCPYGH